MAATPSKLLFTKELAVPNWMIVAEYTNATYGLRVDEADSYLRGVVDVLGWVVGVANSGPMSDGPAEPTVAGLLRCYARWRSFHQPGLSAEEEADAARYIGGATTAAAWLLTAECGPTPSGRRAAVPAGRPTDAIGLALLSTDSSVTTEAMWAKVAKSIMDGLMREGARQAS